MYFNLLKNTITCLYQSHSVHCEIYCFNTSLQYTLESTKRAGEQAVLTPFQINSSGAVWTNAIFTHFRINRSADEHKLLYISYDVTFQNTGNVSICRHSPTWTKDPPNTCKERQSVTLLSKHSAKNGHFQDWKEIPPIHHKHTLETKWHWWQYMKRLKVRYGSGHKYL